MDTKKVTVAVFHMIMKFIVVIIVILLVYKCSVGAYNVGYKVFADDPIAQEPGRDIMVTVTEGMSTKEIGKTLEAKGLVEDANIFHLQNILSSMKDELLPGMYTLNTSMSANEMMEIMSQELEEEEDE